MLQVALPSYLREIVNGIYTESHTSREEQAQIEEAMSHLLEHGHRLAIDFGVDNAVRAAVGAGYMPEPPPPNPAAAWSR